MWAAVKPGGGVLWYDFTVDNPRNADVRGVPAGADPGAVSRGADDVAAGHARAADRPCGRVASIRRFTAS